MKFNDILFSESERFSIGIEEDSGKFYVSIPVSNRMIDYEEYFEIDKTSFDLYINNPTSALSFVERCRKREVDNLLIIQPGIDRGVAT
ncbi:MULTISPECIES: hypothetical protein [Pseudomonas]|uniref:hypothetical protein n=1 Tax=Pseudomonas TaxID=286 RepID=UPI00087D9EFE|nr:MULTISPECIES: hypothetical protein [Pseudomonas]AZD83093.1 hypothetical protein C4K14_0238 [Pseudomonas chlororaphis subsp. aureofaciens]AZD89684.1 hypothetical protein C4K13_0236 [Pseudomonas chlororaphis subsp. aureofaciens]AZD96135.1 hypothetical protein C4K12_0238 [Pseudomonas chlororaphis subsp. aureofaciens]AZE08546.1 hypothetical protein C4K10_0235 [Pseudomonas chlororaphis subsp. aureofaciens]AZE20687.1 hypothetical protein C4K08_0229 [Pseudomonas chlororaphis subsp. aureofaciens]